MNKELEQLKKDLADIQRRIDAMETTNKLDRWKPDDGDNYFHILGDGDIYTEYWGGADIDWARWARGNCYQTKELAQQASELLYLPTMLIHCKQAIEPDWVPDWSNNNQEKCGIRYHYRLMTYKSVWSPDVRLPGGLYFSSKEKAEEAIKWLDHNVGKLK